MEKRKREKNVLAGAAELFDLPADVVAGLPRVELLGDHQLRMENHQGILAYGSDEIHISGGKLGMQLRLSPRDLQKVTGAAFADVTAEESLDG